MLGGVIIRILRNLLIFAFTVGIGLILFTIEMQYLPNHYNFTEQTLSIFVNILLNLGTGLISSVIIIGLYDWRIRLKEEKEKRKKTEFALYKLINTLTWHFSILFGMYIAATKTKRDFKSLDDIFSSDYIKEVQYLDLNSYPARQFNNLTWAQHIQDKVSQFYLDITELSLIDKNYLDTEVVIGLEGMRVSSFILNVRNLSNLLESSNRIKQTTPLEVAPNGLWHTYNTAYLSSLKLHIWGFIQLINIFNHAYPERCIDFANNPWECNEIKDLGVNRAYED